MLLSLLVGLFSGGAGLYALPPMSSNLMLLFSGGCLV
jgi:hypothetical protein